MATTNKTLNVPPLRFSEFDDEWVEHPLSSIASFSKGKGISKDCLTNDGKDCILYGEMYTHFADRPLIVTPILKTQEPVNGLVASKPMDVILPASGETHEDISNACCVIKGKILLSGDINIVRLGNANRFHGDFLSYQLRTPRHRKTIARIAQGDSVVHLQNSQLEKLRIKFPSPAEQTKIVSLLSVIENRIETQKKIIEGCMFGKVFAQNELVTGNCLVPLKVYCLMKSGYAIKSVDYKENGKYKVITIGSVTGDRNADTSLCNKVSKLPLDLQEHQLLKKTDILISLTGNCGRVSLCGTDDCILNQRVGMLRIKDEILREYVFQCLSNSKFEKAMTKRGQGAAQLNIGISDVENYLIPKINDKLWLRLCSKLDERIASEIETLNKLMKMKKFLLESLFI